MPPSSSSAKSTFGFAYFFKLFVSVVLIGYCLYLVEIDFMLSSMAVINLELFGYAFLINIIGTIFFKSAVLWFLLQEGKKVSYKTVVLINLVLRFYTVILPRVAVAGIRWYKYKRLTDGKKSLVLLSLEAVMTLMFLSIGASFFLQFDHSGQVDELLRMSVYLLSLLFLAVFVLLFLYPQNFVVNFLMSKLPAIKLLGGVERMIKMWVEVSQAFYLSGYKGWVVIGFSALNYMFFLLSSYVLMLAMGMELSFAVVAWVRSLILLMANIPITIAGLGVREVGFVVFFGIYAVSPEQAVAYALVSFSLQLGIAVLGALIELYNSLFGVGVDNEG